MCDPIVLVLRSGLRCPTDRTVVFEMEFDALE